MEHLLAMGFGPFDTLARIDLKRPDAQPFIRTLWSWSSHSTSSSPDLLDRWATALMATVQAEPHAWCEALDAVWQRDDWGLWSIDNHRTSAPGSPLWTSAWRTATQTLAVAYGEAPDAPARDPDFWTRPAGLTIVAALAQQLEQPRTPQDIDVVWARLQAQGVPRTIWAQRVPLRSSSSVRTEQAPLAWAAQMGAWKMVARLAALGVSPDTPYDRSTDTPPVLGPYLPVTPLALCLQGLVLNHRVDNHRAVPAFRGDVARAIQALLDGGADLDRPSVLMVWQDAPEDEAHPKVRHHDDGRHRLCGCEPWAGSPSVRDVLRAWVDHPDAHAQPQPGGVLDGVPVELVHAWRARLDNDELRQSMAALPVPDEPRNVPRPRL